MRTKKTDFKKGWYRFFAYIENKDERRDAERCCIYERVTSKKEANLFLLAFVAGLTYGNESLHAKEYGWELMPDNWEKL